MNTETVGHDLPRLLSLLTGDEKHDGSATSTLDVIATLYARVLRVDPRRPDDPDRDRFYVSKGHGPMALYAVLAAHGFVDESALRGWAAYDSPLGRHPDRTLVPGVEIASGSLGHGLALAVGAALALDLRGAVAPRVVCLLGDGELDEGSNHEAIAFAGRIGLARLTAIAIDNGSSSHGWPGGIARRFAVEGWSAVTVDGRDRAALAAALTAPRGAAPSAVVAVVEDR